MDKYIDSIMFEHRLHDQSFRERGFLWPPKYKQSKVRDIWFKGIRHGVKIGLNRTILQGQIIETQGNITNPRQKEFYDKFLKLAQEYNCAIQWHPDVGMCVLDLYENQKLQEDEHQSTA